MIEPGAEVFLRAQGGDRATQDRLVAFYTPYVKRIASLYHREGRGDYDDHVGVAMLGLAKALNFYDPKKNDSFARYAATIIRRDLMTANKKNERRFSKSVFLDQEEDLESLSYEESPDATPVSEFSEMVQALLSHVDPLIREAVQLIAIERESSRDAAAQLGVSHPTLLWMLQRASRTWQSPGIVESREAPVASTLVLWGRLDVQPTQYDFQFG